jgi:hypothetical protein
VVDQSSSHSLHLQQFPVQVPKGVAPAQCASCPTLLQSEWEREVLPARGAGEMGEFGGERGAGDRGWRLQSLCQQSMEGL